MTTLPTLRAARDAADAAWEADLTEAIAAGEPAPIAAELAYYRASAQAASALVAHLDATYPEASS